MFSTLVLGLLLHTLLIPAAVTMALLIVARLLPAGLAPYPGGAAVAIAAGYLAGYLGVYGRPALPPLQALDWLPPLLLVALVLYGALSRFGAGVAVRRTLLGVFVIATSGLLLIPLYRYGLDEAAWVAVGAVAAGWLAAAWLHDRPDDGDPTFGVMLVLVATGNAVIAALTGSVMLGQLSGVLAAVMAAWCLWGGVMRQRPLNRTGRGVALTLLALLLMVGQLYGNTPLWATVMLFFLLALERAVAPLSACLVRNDTPLARVLFTAALSAAPLAVGLYFVVRNSLPPGEF